MEIDVRELSCVSVESMSEARLTNLATLSIERDLSGSLDLDTVVDRFAVIDQGRRLRLK